MGSIRWTGCRYSIRWVPGSSKPRAWSICSAQTAPPAAIATISPPARSRSGYARSSISMGWASGCSYPRRDSDMSNFLNTQLLVIGGGLAGFAAALSAAEAGLQVLLLEKTAATGGSSAMSGGCLAFAGTDLQQERGIEDSAELLFRDLVEVGKGECDEALVRAYADNQLATYEWLKQHGVTFQPVIETASGQSVPRVHNVDPADMVRQLQQAALNTGRVELLHQTRARRPPRALGGRGIGAGERQGGRTGEIAAEPG